MAKNEYAVAKNQKVPDENVCKEIDDRLDSTKKSRRKWELQAFVNMHFIEGNNVYWSDSLQSVQTLPVQSKDNQNDTKRTINFGRKILRGAKNVITANEPHWHVRNSDGVQASPEEKDAAHRLLQSIYRREGMKGLIKDTLDYAFLRTFCIWSVMFDEDKEDVDIAVWDPLDVYPFPCVPDPEEWLCVTLTPSISKDRLRKKYGSIIDTIPTETRPSESEVKSSFINSKGDQSEQDNLILHQYFSMVYPEKKDVQAEEDQEKKSGKIEDEEAEEETEDNSGKNISKSEPYVHKVVKIGQTILEEEDLDYENLKELFAICFAERRAGQLYFTPWMTDVIRLNDSLNRNFTNADEYDRTMAKGRYLAERNTKISMLSTDKHGQVVRYDGLKPEVLNPPTLPQSSVQHREFLIRMMEDVGGLHSDSLGRQSGSADSGRALSVLVAQDQQNVAEPIDNLEEFMANVGRMILKTASKYYAEIKNIYFDDKISEKEQAMPIVGQEASQQLSTVDLQKDDRQKALKIHPFEDIDVDIVPGSAFSDMQAFQMLMEARKANIQIPDSEIIESMKIGNARDYLRQFEIEQQKEDAKDPDTLIAEGIVKKMIQDQVFISPEPTFNLRLQLPIFGQALQAIGAHHPAAPLLMRYMSIAEQLIGHAPGQLNPAGGGTPGSPEPSPQGQPVSAAPPPPPGLPAGISQ